MSAPRFEVPRPLWPRSLNNRLVSKPHLTFRAGRWQCWLWGEAFDDVLPGRAYDRAIAAQRRRRDILASFPR